MSDVLQFRSEADTIKDRQDYRGNVKPDTVHDPRHRPHQWAYGPATVDPTIGHAQILTRPINGATTSSQIVVALGTVFVPAGTTIREDVPNSGWYTTIVTVVDQTLDAVWWCEHTNPTFYDAYALAAAAGTIVDENYTSHLWGATAPGPDSRGKTAHCRIRSNLPLPEAPQTWTDKLGATWTVTDRMAVAPADHQNRIRAARTT